MCEIAERVPKPSTRITNSKVARNLCVKEIKPVYQPGLSVLEIQRNTLILYTKKVFFTSGYVQTTVFFKCYVKATLCWPLRLSRWKIRCVTASGKWGVN